MGVSLSKKLLPFLGTFAFVVACSGGQSFYPSAGQGTASAQTDALRAVLAGRYPPDVVDALMPYATSSCGVQQKTPGTYSLLIAQGAVRNGTFTADSKSLWYQTLITPTTKPIPSPSSDPSPPTVKFNLYFGAYALKKTGHGCLIMEASANGGPLKPDKYSAFSVGFPALKTKDKYDTFKFLSQGPLAMTISGLTKVGSGTATLNNSGGGVYDSGTISDVIKLP
jgi:hypothetical protein